MGLRKDVASDGLTFPPAPDYFSPTSKEASQGSPTWRAASAVFEPLTPELIEQYIEKHFRHHTELTDEAARNLLQSLESGLPIDENDPCNIHMQPTEKMQRQLRATRLNGSRMDAGPEFELRCHANGYGGHKDVYGRMYIHLPSNTMTTGCHNP